MTSADETPPKSRRANPPSHKPSNQFERQFFGTMTWPKCKALVRKVLVFLVSLFLGAFVIKRTGDYYASHLVGFRQGNMRRFCSILALEWTMAHLTVPMYQHLFSAFAVPTSMPFKFSARGRNERFRHCCLLAFGFMVFLAHLTYLLYLPESVEVPWLLYDLSALCNGVWINLCVPSLLFTAYNLGLKIASTFPIGQSCIHQLFRVRPLKLISANHRFQTGFTLLLALALSTTHWFYSDMLVIRHQKIHLQRHTADTQQSLKAVVVTDLHAGASVYGKQISRVVQRVNQLDADAVFLIGDIIDAPRSLIERRVESLRHLQSHLGTFYVTGNHEYYYGNVDEWFELFHSYGIHVLKNKAVNLKGHCVVGLNDIFSDKSGLHNHIMDVRAIRHCHRNQSTIVLEHNPAGAKKIVEFSENSSHPVDLILSGHTHKGQYLVLVPFAWLILPYFYGLYSLANGATQLLVSAGTLFQNAPMKTPFTAEIWLLDIMPKV